MALKHAEFKTAYLQRAIAVDVCVASFVKMNVNTLVKFVGGAHPAIVPATGLDDATHIIAQSDMSLIPGARPKMEVGDYAYSDAVAPGLAASGVTADTNFLGAYATNPTSGVTASNKWIYNTTDGKVYKSTYSSSTLTWAADSSVAADGLHKVNLYPIFDKTDIVVVD